MDANEVLRLHLLDPQKEQDFVEAATIPADMCHQYFGDAEVSSIHLSPING